MKTPNKSNNPEFFSQFIDELLPEGQSDFFCYWLSIALKSMILGDFRPGQFVVLAGERQCGKSLLQYIITEILGGRAANPFEYLIGEEKFNADMIGAEHWLIEDPRGSIDMRTRRDFGARLKEATVNRDIRVRAMNKDGVLLRLFRRITISVNLELEYLSVLPPFDPSISDKGFLFLCAPVKAAFDRFRENGDKSQDKTWAHILTEVPIIRAWLLRNFPAKNIPPAFRDDRFGIVAWHHPHLIAELTSMSHEARLLELIDEMAFPKRVAHGKLAEYTLIEGLRELPASEIQTRLLVHNRFESEKILKYPGACGSHLGKLAKTNPERVSKKVNTGKTFWTINPPVQTKD
jgi:hypothetical protein